MLIDKVAEELGIQLGKPFMVYDEGTRKYSFCFLKGVGLVNSVSREMAPNILIRLLNGKARFAGYIEEEEEEVKEERFIPKIGDRYWYIPLPLTTETSGIWGGTPDGYVRSLSSNFFRTRKEARKAKKELIKEYNEYMHLCRMVENCAN